MVEDIQKLVQKAQDDLLVERDYSAEPPIVFTASIFPENYEIKPLHRFSKNQQTDDPLVDRTTVQKFQDDYGLNSQTLVPKLKLFPSIQSLRQTRMA
jgi:hypothetical protein